MYQETLIILKPDTLERNLIGACLKRFEDAGLKIIDVIFLKKVEKTLLEKHYPNSMAIIVGKKAQLADPSITDPLTHGLKILKELRKHFTRGPVIAIRFSGDDAIAVARRVTGYTDPATAEKGTIRSDFGVDSIKKSTNEGRACENLIHASGNPEEAKYELELWFGQ